jgi:hypothetical protein
VINEKEPGMLRLLFGDKKKPDNTTDDPWANVTEPTPLASTLEIASGKEDAAILLPVVPPFGLKLGATSQYTPVPANQPSDASRRACWRIELHGVAPDAGPIGFDIVGDVILGRNTGGSHDADIDFERYRGSAAGVSRRHAMLRPSANTLFLMDMDSTNGTLHNASRLPASTVRAVHDGDTISLGNLAFLIKIIDGPFRSPAKPTGIEEKPDTENPRSHGL